MIRQEPLFIAVCLLCVFVACGNSRDDVADVSVGEPYAPRVRLVKDTERLFHYQWDKPLKEERIILVTAEDKSESFSFLVYFPKEAFISVPHRIELRATVEILSAHERDTFPLPAYAHSGMVAVGTSSGDPQNEVWRNARRYILREHPFKPYRVGVPSRIALDPSFNY